MTSFDTRPFNLKGWRWDDSSQSVAPGNAYVFTNDVILRPGETAVFVENMTPAAFRAWWGTNLPADLQVVTYIGGGLGLSQTSDAVNLWNAVTLPGNELAERICGINFAVSYVGWTFVYDPENPPLSGVFNVPATNTVSGTVANGIFAASVGGSFGSPGYVTAPIRVTGQPSGGAVALTWNSAPNRNYTVEYKDILGDSEWMVLSNLTGSATSATITTTNAGPERFYRVAAQIPIISEP